MNNNGGVSKEEKKNNQRSRPEVKCISVCEMDAGKDELNLADFPFAALSDRVPLEQKSLVFEDIGWDKLSKEMVVKKVTISPSVDYGLPTARDEDVILGLIQFSKADSFSGRTISFVPCELFRLLGWRKEGRSYSRVDESLRRWVDVTLYCDRAWWDEDQEAWVDKHFHLLDDVSVVRASKKNPRRPPPWSITWSEVLFRSFKRGYFRQLDLSVYRELERGSSRRMYRFLGKRFHFGNRQVFSLRAFACERIGFSRTSDNSELKRQLMPAIRELEAVGIIEPMTKEERYRKVGRGLWEIVFLQKPGKRQRQSSKQTRHPLEEALMARSATQQVAVRLVAEYPGTLIQEKIDAIDGRMKGDDGPLLKNPPGFLVKSIQEDLQCGSGGVGNSPKRSCKGAVPEKALGQTKCKRAIEEDLQDKAEQNAVREYLEKLSEEELKILETEAVSQAEPFHIDGYKRSLELGSEQLLRDYREMIITAHVRKLLGLQAKESPPGRA